MICVFLSIKLAPLFPQIFLPLFNLLLPPPPPPSNMSPLTSSTPKMERVHSVASVRTMTTFTRSLDFLDSQSSFHLIFGSKRMMFRLSQQENNHCATENTEYVSNKLRDFCQLRQLHIFCDAVQLQYVGTTSYDSHKTLPDISLALSSFKIVSKLRGRTISRLPNNLFSRFIESPFLPLTY